VTDFYVASVFITFVTLVITSFNTQKWVVMVELSLVLGAAMMLSLNGDYINYSFYLFQMLLVLLGTSFFIRGRTQKLLVAVATAVLVSAGLIKDALHFDHLRGIEYTILLYAAYALMPLLFFSPVSGKKEELEKTICFQQTWVRILFFRWSLTQGVNISHYDLYNQYVVVFAAMALGVIFLAVIWRKKLFWTLAQQSILSLLVLSVCLGQIHVNSKVIFGWILLLALSSLLPKVTAEIMGNRTLFVKRLEYGAFGGGVFWSLLLIAHMGSSASVEGSMLWTFIIFLTGFFSWIREVPSPTGLSTSNSSNLLLLGVRAVVQIILGFIFIFPI